MRYLHVLLILPRSVPSPPFEDVHDPPLLETLPQGGYHAIRGVRAVSRQDAVGLPEAFDDRLHVTSDLRIPSGFQELGYVVLEFAFEGVPHEVVGDLARILVSVRMVVGRLEEGPLVHIADRLRGTRYGFPVDHYGGIYRFGEHPLEGILPNGGYQLVI